MGSRSERVLTVVLLLLAVILAMFVSPDEGRDAFDPRASSLRATPSGTLGLFLLLDDLGIPVDRRLTPYADAGPLRGTLVLLAPHEDLSPREIDVLVDWIDGGGRLLYAARPEDPLLAAFGLILHPVSEDGDGSSGIAAMPSGPHRWTMETDAVYPFHWQFADTSPAMRRAGVTRLLETETDGIAALSITRGEGMILAWSDPAPIVNRSLPGSGAAAVFARLAADLASDGRTLYFDEYHHGFRGGGSPVQALTDFVSQTGAGRMSLQLALAGIGLLLLLGYRFGAPRPPPEVRRRSPLEHQLALAEAYRVGGARNTARRLLIAGAARRLGRPAPAAGSEVEFISRLTSGSAPPAEQARALLGEWQKGDRADLVTLAHQVDCLVKETGRP